MNTRDYKEFAQGEYYHLYNRGNGKMDIFRAAADYRFLLTRLREYLSPNTMGTIARGEARRKSFPEGAFSLVCYCLMPNHFHFLMRQNSDVSIGTLMLNLWTGYSKYFNKTYDRVGSLFQDQFKAIHIDNDTYLKWLSAYIHQNPTVAGLCLRPEDYAFSSYGEYVGEGVDGVSQRKTILDYFDGDISAYRDFVSESLDEMKERKELTRYLIDAV